MVGEVGGMGGQEIQKERWVNYEGGESPHLRRSSLCWQQNHYMYFCGSGSSVTYDVWHQSKEGGWGAGEPMVASITIVHVHINIHPL